MKINIVVTLLFLVVGHTTQAAVVFNPCNLISQQGTWRDNSGNHKGEHYLDYIYNGKVVFRVLPRYAASVDILIQVALEKNESLRLEDPSIIYFSSQQSISTNFSVIPFKYNHNHITIDPKTLSFDTQHDSFLGTTKQYSISFAKESENIKVSKSVFKALKIAKNAAKDEWLKIDLAAIGKKNITRTFVSLVAPPQIVNNNVCVICLENDKNIMLEPCNHVCLCEECAKKELKTCPICQQATNTRKKVFY